MDRGLSPPPNCANITYVDRWLRCLRDIKEGREVLRNIVNFIRFGLLLAVACLIIPFAYILKLLGYRFITVDMSQIGSGIYLDLFLRDDYLERGGTPRHKMLCLASYYTDGNRYMMDLYNDRVIFVRNMFVKFLLSPLFMCPVFHDNSYKYDFVYHIRAVAHDIWNEYLEKTGSHMISFPEKDISVCRDILAPYVPKDQKFVALHVRDSGFYDDPTRIARNADIRTYRKGIAYLIEKGYAVIRLGDPTADKIHDMAEELGPMFFDYAFSDIKSEMMDCFFLSQCEFFIGQASGPASVPQLFGVNSCNVNWYNASNTPNFIEGDVGSFKKFFYKKDDSVVPFQKLMKPPFSLNPSQATLDANGAYYANNTEEEVYGTIKEYVENPEGKTTELQRKAKALLDRNNYACGAKGDFSNTILEAYKDEILST